MPSTNSFAEKCETRTFCTGFSHQFASFVGCYVCAVDFSLSFCALVHSVLFIWFVGEAESPRGLIAPWFRAIRSPLSLSLIFWFILLNSANYPGENKESDGWNLFATTTKKPQKKKNGKRKKWTPRTKNEKRNEKQVCHLWIMVFRYCIVWCTRESARARAESSIKSTRDRVKCKYRLLNNIKINDSSFLL